MLQKVRQFEGLYDYSRIGMSPIKCSSARPIRLGAMGLSGYARSEIMLKCPRIARIFRNDLDKSVDTFSDENPHPLYHLCHRRACWYNLWEH